MPEAIPTHLPSYLTEAAFRVYEPFISRGVSSFPIEYEVPREQQRDLAGYQLSPFTFCARWRDAITSLRRFGWSTFVDTDKLLRISGEFNIRLDQSTGSVWFRGKVKQGRQPEFQSEAVKMYPEKGSKAVHEVWTNWSGEELSALVLLLHHQRLYGPFVLDGAVGQLETQRFETEFNVALTFDEVKNQTIII